MHNWETVFGARTPALAEGAVWERVGVDPLSLLDKAPDRARLAGIYEEYAGVAKHWSLPIVVFAPTWRANRENSRAGMNQRAVDFVRQFSKSAGALMGPRNDCYQPAAALSRKEARDFHSWQASELADADFILVSTMPSMSEALGIADVVTVPYLISFVITSRGELLDGTPLSDAISQIDSAVERRPVGYWINCVHPRTIMDGLSAAGKPAVIERILGVQGNTSNLDPRSFSTTADFQGESPASFAAAMMDIYRRFSISILGGCCGTRRDHLAEIAKLLAEEKGISGGL